MRNEGCKVQNQILIHNLYWVQVVFLVTFYTAASCWMALGTIAKLKADFVKHSRGALICSKCFLAALECHTAAMPEAFLRHT